MGTKTINVHYVYSSAYSRVYSSGTFFNCQVCVINLESQHPQMPQTKKSHFSQMQPKLLNGVSWYCC